VRKRIAAGLLLVVSLLGAACSSGNDDSSNALQAAATPTQTGDSESGEPASTQGAAAEQEEVDEPQQGAPALAGEMSGHLFFSDRWYGFDDALYAAARLLEILAASPESPTERFAALPKGIATPELRVEMSEGEPERFMERLVRAMPDAPGFAGARLDTLDGMRADFTDGWALVRSSNTSPSLTLRLEADSDAALERISGDVRNLLVRLDPGLDVPL